MDAYHKSKGHKMIDYNFVVMPNGEVFNGRGLSAEGGSVNNSNYLTKGINARAVAVCCVGDFNKNKMPDAQFAALKKLVADIVVHHKFESINQIKSHGEVAGFNYTDCPGKYFPTDVVREYIRNGGDVVVPAGTTEENKYMYTVNVGKLNMRKGAGKEYKILKTLKRGDKLILDSYFAPNKWAKVKYGDMTGYVYFSYIKEG